MNNHPAKVKHIVVGDKFAGRTCVCLQQLAGVSFMTVQSVSLVRYQPRYQPGVVALILPIQNEEFSINITA
ncbi:hypothetical protein LU631_05910 [Erwinia tracheiphila]|uniref:hypothetical protein n=1 Tax=Erwinia tracheiphila TaxID=65700 RepID=UPI00039E8FC1|nr:hypothetical protein [Erwinia tracheiphila]UIA82860.1 hypothetical protein LU604_20890 [Erwinia tracheiphila]UIA88859.1 hypothetical protein LU631_05910 [Erwinia tracheiphila]UIA91447.1 hypothetical protein LU632_20400 [Erwinia tracheiphila]UIA97240.1 hypothetical protein LU633_04580 [Erwinia tracheiphila]